MAAIDTLDELLVKVRTIRLVPGEIQSTMEYAREIAAMQAEWEHQPEYTITTTGAIGPVKNRKSRREALRVKRRPGKRGKNPWVLGSHLLHSRD